MSDKIISEKEVGWPVVNGKALVVTRSVWRDADGLSYDVHDARGVCLTEAESFDDYPTDEQLAAIVSRERTTVTMTDTFTPDQPFSTIRYDVNGWKWEFAYWGSGFVYIRDIPNELSDPMPPIDDISTRDDWPYLIDLNYHAMRPADVTAAWLEERATEWTADRDEDIRKGNI